MDDVSNLLRDIFPYSKFWRLRWTIILGEPRDPGFPDPFKHLLGGEGNTLLEQNMEAVDWEEK